MYNRDKFFKNIKETLFKKFNQKQVEGLELILSYAEEHNVNTEYLAYILATTYHETAYTMQPVREYGGNSYLKKKKYWPFVGRGYVQLTWKDNYIKAGKKLGIDLLGNPNLALQPDIAVKILFIGMEEGWFTGKNLSSYMDGIDESDAEDRKEYVLSRWLINGKDKRDKIAGEAIKFEHALRDSLEVQTVEEQKVGHTTDGTPVWLFIIELLKALFKRNKDND